MRTCIGILFSRVNKNYYFAMIIIILQIVFLLGAFLPCLFCCCLFFIFFVCLLLFLYFFGLFFVCIALYFPCHCTFNTRCIIKYIRILKVTSSKALKSWCISVNL